MQASAHERIKPFGQVAVAGEDNSALAIPETAVPVAGRRPRRRGRRGDADGRQVGRSMSPAVACHGTGIAGAPRIGDKAAWASRIAQGAATLEKHAHRGIPGANGHDAREGRPHRPLGRRRPRGGRIHGVAEPLARRRLRLPVEPPVADRLRQLPHADPLEPGQVRDRARNAQDPVAGARRKAEPARRRVEQAMLAQPEPAGVAEAPRVEERVQCAARRLAGTGVAAPGLRRPHSAPRPRPRAQAPRIRAAARRRAGRCDRAGVPRSAPRSAARRAACSGSGRSRRPHSRRDRDSWRRRAGIAPGNWPCQAARARLTVPVSSGSRSASSTSRRYSGSSSRNSTPRCASVISPGRRRPPPPMTAVADAPWCGARNGGRRHSATGGSGRTSECSIADSSASSSSSGGSSPGRRCAIMLLPAPGGPTKSRLCEPAAAISSARFAPAWPRTSARSGAAAAHAGSAGAGRRTRAPRRR